jgi:4-diphosphocytidyl-2-C-methyl-D-erythritol kinase
MAFDNRNFFDENSERISLIVPAKLNIYLQAGKAREDGYHDLTTVYQAIALHDELRIMLPEPRTGLTMTVSGEGSDTIPTDGRNLVIKAAQVLASHAGIKPVACFELIKSIPSEAGLGGGSADAAAALVGCNILWKLGLHEEDLAAIGAQIGEDVPFLIKGMMAIGVGHKQPLVAVAAGAHMWHWVLGILEAGLLTKDVFRKFDEFCKYANADDLDLAYEDRHMKCLHVGWGSTSPDLLAGLLGNDLEAAASALLPQILSALDAGRAEALAGIITGSGSTCAFLARDHEHAKSIASVLRTGGIFKSVMVTHGPVEGVRIIAQPAA